MAVVGLAIQFLYADSRWSDSYLGVDVALWVLFDSSFCVCLLKGLETLQPFLRYMLSGVLTVKGGLFVRGTPGSLRSDLSLGIYVACPNFDFMEPSRDNDPMG